MTGSIPTDLAALQRLEVLKLDGNNLSGTIPIELGEIKTLGKHLDLIFSDFFGLYKNSHDYFAL